MLVRWLEAALSDLITTFDFIAQENESVAESQVDRVWEQVEQLAHFPELGRIGRLPRTRELVIAGTPYIVAYRVDADIVFILGVLHGARRWPMEFKNGLELS